MAISEFSSGVKVFVISSITMMLLNSSLNPVVYCWKMRHIRHAILDTLRNVFPSHSWIKDSVTPCFIPYSDLVSLFLFSFQCSCICYCCFQDGPHLLYPFFLFCQVRLSSEAGSRSAMQFMLWRILHDGTKTWILFPSAKARMGKILLITWENEIHEAREDRMVVWVFTGILRITCRCRGNLHIRTFCK